MKNFLFLRLTTGMLIFLLLFASCSISVSSSRDGFWGRTIKGNGHIVTEQLEISDYNQVSIAGSMDVEYALGPSPKLQCSIDENLLEYVDIYVEKGVLYVSLKDGSYSPTKFIVKTTSSALSKVSLAGSGDFVVKTPIRSSGSLSVSLSGSGDLKFPSTMHYESMGISLAGSGDIVFSDIKTASLSVSLAGSGDVKLKGDVPVTSYSLAGSGDINAYELFSENVKAQLVGSGDLKLYAAKTLSASGTSSGDIYVKGNPSISQSWVGSGGLHVVK